MVQFSFKPSWRDRFNLSQFAINHAGITLFFWILISVAGLFAFSSLRYALFPDITFPVVVVSASAPLSTALETEAALTNPLETELAPLEQLNRIFSTTYPGQSVLNLRFQVGTDLETSTAAVETTLKQMDLPPEATYQVIPLNLNEEAAVSYTILAAQNAASDDLEALAQISETEIIPRIEAVPGVLRVDLLGTAAQTPLAPQASSNPTAANLQNPPTLIRFQGKPALAFQVIKQGNANTLEVVKRVEETVQQVQADLSTVQLVEAATQAHYIQETTQATIDSLWLAIVLAVLIIFVFLRNWRATLITALAIPTSLLGTCIVMAGFGLNLETITLLALALVIGITVDDAIVEVENIIRHLETGKSPKQAALTATNEIGMAVSICTWSIVAVFLPVAFMGGTVGQFFKPFGLTIAAAVLTSLLVARTLSPVLAMYWLRGSGNGGTRPVMGDEGKIAENPVGLILDAPAGDGLSQGYSRLLAWALRHRGLVMGLAIASLIGGIALIPLVPQGFIPKLDRGEFNITYQTALPRPSAALAAPAGQGNSNPATNSLQLIFARSQQVAIDLERETLAMPSVDSVFTTIGVRGKPNQGRLYVKLKPDRELTTAEVQDQLRQTLPVSDSVVTSVEDLQFVDTGGEKPLQVILVGDDLAQLRQAVTEIQTKVKLLPGFVDVTVSGGHTATPEITEIDHREGKRVAYVTANLSQDQVLGQATDEVVAIAQSVIPAGVSLDLGGDSARLGEIFSSFALVLGLAIICLLIVLLIPFGRLLEPTVIGLSLPFAIVGAMLALLITRSDFGMISVIGLLFLLGLLDKNALLLLDYINQLRQAGLSREKAIMTTGLVRLRPILMTTASTILGMLPIALGLGAGSELRQPMAVAIIGGLVTSTLLTLIIVPVLYALLEDSWHRLQKTQPPTSSKAM